MKWEGNRESDNVEDIAARAAAAAAASDRRAQHRDRHHRRGADRRLDLRHQPADDAGHAQRRRRRRRCSSQAPGARAARRTTRWRSFVSTVLADTEDVWTRAVPAGRRAATASPSWCCSAAPCRTACGAGQSAMGPFYCPGDQKVYIDLDFYDDAASRLGAPGDFAQAYVIAHEVGHHVQNLLGITRQGRRRARARQQAQGNALSRAGRAAGRLLRRRLGQPRAAVASNCWSRATSRRR